MREKAIEDERPAYVHGNQLLSLVMREQMSWMQAMKTRSGQKKVDAIGDNVSDHLLNRKAIGWLRYLYRKCVTDDDWSEDGDPHEWWDRATFAPMSSFPRFDLHESSYFVLLAFDRTPAWSEAYEVILKGLSKRYTTFWGAVDWMTQFGHDEENRESYPPEFKGMLIPEKLFGNYDMPGYVCNGIVREPADASLDIERDPIESDAMLFYKGWLTLVLGIRERVCSSSQKTVSFKSLDVKSNRTWNYDSVSRKLHDQFNSNEGWGLA